MVPKGTKLVNLSVFDHLGPVWTISNKNWFFALKYLLQTLLCPIRAKKKSKRDQNDQPKCFWPFGTLLDLSGSFWTISNKNWFFAPKHLCQTLLCPFGAKNWNCAIATPCMSFNFYTNKSWRQKVRRNEYLSLEVDFEIPNSKSSPCLLQKNVMISKKSSKITKYRNMFWHSKKTSSPFFLGLIRPTLKLINEVQTKLLNPSQKFYFTEKLLFFYGHVYWDKRGMQIICIICKRTEDRM